MLHMPTTCPAVAVVELLSHVQLFATPWTAARQVSLPSLSPGVCSNSCPLSLWYYLTISSSAALFSFHFQPFPTSGSLPMSWLFAPGGQSIGASASALPVNIQGWIPLGWADLISLLSKKLSRAFFSATIWKHQFFGSQPLFGPTLISIHDYWKTIVLTNTDRFQQSDSAF